MADEKSTKRNARFIDLTGRRFGKLLVLSISSSKNNMARWDCACDCGSRTTVYGGNLRRGLSTSCGCYKAEWTIAQFTTHGMTSSREYRKWCSAKARCFNPKTMRYPHYGGRGITMCAEWRDSFEQFLSDMGKCPEGMELDRIDTNGDYEPGNCRWISRTGNMRNRQNASYATHDGETLPLKEWSERTGIKYETLINRVKRGLPLIAPPGPTARRNK